MSVVEANPVTAQAVLSGTAALVTFGPKPYTRKIKSVHMENPAGGKVTIYKGTSNAARVLQDSHSVGSNQTYTVPFLLPAGHSLFVEWANVPSPVSAAFVVLTWWETR